MTPKQAFDGSRDGLHYYPKVADLREMRMFLLFEAQTRMLAGAPSPIRVLHVMILDGRWDFVGWFQLLPQSRRAYVFHGFCHFYRMNCSTFSEAHLTQT